MEHAAPTDLLKSPLGVALLTIAAGLTGSLVKDRLFTEARDTGNVVRIDSVDRRLTEIGTANEKAHDQIRQDLRDIKLWLEERDRARDPRR